MYPNTYVLYIILYVCMYIQASMTFKHHCLQHTCQLTESCLSYMYVRTCWPGTACTFVMYTERYATIKF